jgi:hypothetical protein
VRRLGAGQPPGPYLEEAFSVESLRYVLTATTAATIPTRAREF